MIVEERMTSYIHSLEAGMPEYLENIRREAVKTNVPIIRRETGSLIRFLCRMQDPKQILEVGCAVGFSALWMCECAENAHITTIEKVEQRIREARKNIREAGKEDRITLLEGDALQILPTLDLQADLVFVDAAKGQYLSFLPEVFRILTPGGILISDNVLQDGDVAESRYAVTRRDRTIHQRMRDYLYELQHREDLTTTVLTVGDGVALSVKSKDPEEPV